LLTEEEPAAADLSRLGDRVLTIQVG
jgi:hypothetical protein